MDTFRANKTIKVGDILHCSGGYNSKFNIFTVVTKRTSKTIDCQEIETEYASHDGYGQNGMETVSRDENGDVILKSRVYKYKRVNQNRNMEYVTLYPSSHGISIAMLWDGKAKDFYSD